MSLDTPPAIVETTKQYLVAYLMMQGLTYQAVEYRQDKDQRWYSYFCFEQTEDLLRHLSEYDRRVGEAKAIRAFVDCLFGVKDVLRANRNQAKPKEGVNGHGT